jgi:hypothetical protein
MTEPPTFRRHADGSIDFDFYRARAADLRRQAMRDVANQHIAPAFTVMAGALGFALLLPSTSGGRRDLIGAASTKPRRAR